MVTRRDFLNGIALSTAAASLAPRELLGLAADAAEGPYPPALTGLRGSTDGSYAAAHLLRDGLFWERAGTARDTGEAYDLVVVGGGVSGLAAAYYYRQAAGPKARVLILDNHDDFGGHARRNEFTHAGRPLIGYGGSFSIESPAPYSAVARRLVRTLGVDVARWPKVVDPGLYARLGMRAGVFFDRETFGADRLLPAPPMTDLASEAAETAPAPPDAWTTFLAAAPLDETAKRDLLRLHTERVDYLPGLTSAQKKAKLARMSYADFLTGPARCDRQVAAFFQARPHALYGVGSDAMPAQDAWGLGFPGFDGMGLSPARRSRHEPRRGAFGRARVLLPLPRRQRDARAPARARARPGVAAGGFGGGAGGRALRLRDARRGGRPRPRPPRQHGGEGRAPRRRGGARGRGHLRAGNVARDGARAALHPRLLERDDPVHLPGAAGAAEGGARATRSRCRSSTRTCCCGTGRRS